MDSFESHVIFATVLEEPLKFIFKVKFIITDLKVPCSSNSVMSNVLDYCHKESDFKLQSRFNLHFQSYALGIDMSPPSE